MRVRPVNARLCGLSERNQQVRTSHTQKGGESTRQTEERQTHFIELSLRPRYLNAATKIVIPRPLPYRGCGICCRNAPPPNPRHCPIAKSDNTICIQIVKNLPHQEVGLPIVGQLPIYANNQASGITSGLPLIRARLCQGSSASIGFFE